MATTQNGIYYPTDGTQPADVLADMKKMAESMEEAIINNKFDPKEINDNITKIQEEQTTQKKAIEDNATAIKKNTTDITKLQEENTKLKAQIPKGQASGEEVNLQDSAEMELADFGLEGSSKQEIETGKNKAILPDMTKEINGMTVNIKDGVITITGKSNVTYVTYLKIGTAKIESGRSYYLNDFGKKSGSVSLYVNETSVWFPDNIGQEKAWQANVSGTFNIQIGLGVGESQDWNLKLMLCEEEGQEWVEGKEPKPTLENPSEVAAVGDNGSVEIVTSNKNLFNIPDFKGTQSGVTLNITNGNHIKITGTSTSGTTFYILNSNINKKKLENINKIAFGKTITIQKNSIPNNSIEFNVGVSGNGYFMQLFKSTLSKTALLSKEIIMFTIYIPANTEWDWETDLQLEISNQATDIVQPKGNTYTLPVQKPFYKIGDYTDAFIKQDGKWYEQHYIKKLILTGEENLWQLYTNNPRRFGLNIKTDLPKIYVKSTDFGSVGYGTGYCTNFIVNTNANDDLTMFLQRNTNEWYVAIIDINSNWSDITALKNYLKEQYILDTPVTIWYLLETPELIECTEEQIQVLEQIIADGTYKGVTHYYTTQDLKPTIEVKYYKDLETIINKQEQMQATLNNVQAQILELGG